MADHEAPKTDPIENARDLLRAESDQLDKEGLGDLAEGLIWFATFAPDVSIARLASAFRNTP